MLNLWSKEIKAFGQKFKLVAEKNNSGEPQGTTTIFKLVIGSEIHVAHHETPVKAESYIREYGYEYDRVTA